MAAAAAAGVVNRVGSENPKDLVVRLRLELLRAASAIFAARKVVYAQERGAHPTLNDLVRAAFNTEV